MRKQVIQGKASQCGCHLAWAPQVAQTVKYLPAMWETQVQSLGWEDLLEKGMAPCLENSMDRGAWRATVHGITKSQT